MVKELAYIYGKHAVVEALRFAPQLIKELYIAPTVTDDKVLGLLSATTASPRLLNEKRLPGGLRNDAVHQGLVAGIAIQNLMLDYKPFIANLTITQDTSFLVLGEVQDPHNVGAVIRSAAACGVTAVLIPPHNQAPVNGTVVKVSAGMAFRIPLVTISNVNATLTDLKKRGCFVYGLAGEPRAVALPNEQFTKPSVFVLGNEGEGLRKMTREACDTLLSIPMHSRAESFNAAAATAIVLYAWSVQHPKALS